MNTGGYCCHSGLLLLSGVIVDAGFIVVIGGYC